MRPRLPRAEQDWVVADCNSVRELATAYAPTLAFASGEKFFPVMAETYLAHTSYGPWPDLDDPLPESGMHHLLATDDAHRGTALVLTDRTGGGLTVSRIGGAPNPRGRPLQFSSSANDPDAIGRDDLTGSGGAAHSLIFGGWKDSGRSMGDEQYVASVFSEFADSMSPERAVPWDDPPRATLSTLWIAQPPTPTVYAEVDWTGRFPDIAAGAGLDDFAPAADEADMRRLDQLLQVTYYYLFPIRRPATDDAPEGERAVRREGQWQAVTIVFEARLGREYTLNEEGRPVGLEFHEPPLVAILSDRFDDPPVSGVVDWPALEKFKLTLVGTAEQMDSTSAVIFVGRGTHAFLAQPVSGEHPTGEDGGADSDEIGVDDFEDEGGIGGFFLAILVILLAIIIIALAIALLAIIVIVIAALLGAGLALLLGIALGAFLLAALLAILAIIAGLAWLEDWFDDEGREPHRHEGNEEAEGDGPAGSPPPTSTDGTQGPTPGGATGTGGYDDPTRTGTDVDAGAYPSGAGALTGHNSASFDVRVIDRLAIHDASSFPPVPGICERPVWWDFSGGWGVPVRVQEASGWTSGMPRVDEHGRSWAYWHAVALDEDRSKE